MHRFYSIVLLLVLSSALNGCRNQVSGNPDSMAGKLTVTGSSTIAPVVSEMARRFEANHPGVRIDVHTGGSSRGIRDTCNGTADIGMSSRDLNPEESKDISVDTLGLDGVTFVVNQNNPIRTLTRTQLTAIYTGQIENWSELGGHDAPIIVSHRAEGRSEVDIVCDYLGISPTEIKADVIDGETQKSIKTVANNVNAIVYTSIGAAQISANSGEPVKLLPLNNVSASTESVQSGDFPMARPLILIRKSNPSRTLIEEFIKFCLLPENDDIVVKLGFVPSGLREFDQGSSNVNHLKRPTAR